MNIKILLQRTLGSVLCLTLMTAMVFVSCEEIYDQIAGDDTPPADEEEVLPEPFSADALTSVPVDLPPRKNLGDLAESSFS